MHDRRTFLKTAGAFAVLSAVGCGQEGGEPPPKKPQQEKPPEAKPQEGEAAKAGPLFTISLAQWSLHRRLFGRVEDPDLKLDNLDFARTARGHGIDAIEYVNAFFKDKAEDKAYLGQMKQRAADEGVESLLIMIDGEGMLGHPDEQERQAAVTRHHRWVDAAKFLGCHSIRVNAASRGSYAEQQKLAADGLSRLTEYGSAQEINVIVENHGGLSSNGAWLAGVMKLVDNERCGTLPDFGNFRLGGGEEYDRYKGVEELMPFAKAVSAKSYAFDEDGDETTIDYLRMMGIVVTAGYRGRVGIEYEGSRLSEDDGIRKTRELLERVREQLS